MNNKQQKIIRLNLILQSYAVFDELCKTHVDNIADQRKECLDIIRSVYNRYLSD